MRIKKIALLIASILLISSVLSACEFSFIDKFFDNTPDTDPTSPDTDPTDDTTDTESTTFDYGIGLTDGGFIEGLNASDYVKNFEYKGVSIPESVFEFDQETYDEQINAILGYYDFYTEIKDRPVADKDTVNIDYVGYVDGVAFENGSTEGQGTVVTIGVTNYIDDFLEQLIGHMPGETFDVNVTFPDPYQNDTILSGKDAVFNVTINYIHGEKKPELTDEIAKDYGFSTVEELEEDLKNWVYSNSKYAYVNTLLETFEVTEIPQRAIDYVVEFYRAYYTVNATMLGTDLDSYVKNYLGYESYDDFIAKNYEDVKDSAIFYVRFQAIAELEGLEVTDEELKDSEYYDSLDRYGIKYLKMLYLQEVEVVNLIFDNRKA